MSERPTLEQIAACEADGYGESCSARRDAALAREIIALREAHVYLATYVGVSEENARDGLEGHRQDALESQARPFQESGELAVGREVVVEHQSTCAILMHPYRCTCGAGPNFDLHARIDDLENRLGLATSAYKDTVRSFEAMEAERDAAMRRTVRVTLFIDIPAELDEYAVDDFVSRIEDFVVDDTYGDGDFKVAEARFSLETSK